VIADIEGAVGWVGRGRGHDRLASRRASRHDAVSGDDPPDPDPRRGRHTRAGQTVSGRPTSVSRPISRTSAGSRTSRTTGRPGRTADPAPTSRSSAGWRTTPGLRVQLSPMS